MTNRDTQETLLCIAFVFEVSTSEHGAQHHIYRLVKDWRILFLPLLPIMWSPHSRCRTRILLHFHHHHCHPIYHLHLYGAVVSPLPDWVILSRQASGGAGFADMLPPACCSFLVCKEALRAAWLDLLHLPLPHSNLPSLEHIPAASLTWEISTGLFWMDRQLLGGMVLHGQRPWYPTVWGAKLDKSELVPEESFVWGSAVWQATPPCL